MDLMRRRRQAQGFTQAELAALVAVNVNSIAKWERGEAVPRPRHLRKLADALAVDAFELLTDIEQMQSESDRGNELAV